MLLKNILRQAKKRPASGPGKVRMKDFLRKDNPAYNKMFSQWFNDNPDLAKDEAAVTKAASKIYELTYTLPRNKFTEDNAELIRSALLLEIVASFEVLPMLKPLDESGRFFVWGAFSVIDLSDLTKAERATIAGAFGGFDFYEDEDLERATFTSISTKQSCTPSGRYQRASIELARDAARLCMYRHLKLEDKALEHRRPWLSRIWDRTVLAYG